MFDVRIEGGNRLAALGARLRESGDRELKKQLLRRIREAAKPLAEATQAAARSQLPRRGGLAARIAAKRPTISTRLTGDKAGVRLRRTGLAAASSDLRGLVRHPVYGNRRVWTVTRTHPGWFTGTLAGSDSLGTVRTEILQALDDVTRAVTK